VFSVECVKPADRKRTSPGEDETAIHLFATCTGSCYRPVDAAKESGVNQTRPEVLQGTLDLMILKALDALGPLHGFGIARRLEQVSGDVLRLNEGTVYTALLRLGQQGWIASTWGVSDRNRKARYYSITRAGRRQLARETEGWEQIAGVVNRVLKLAPGEE
jgi:PadR family transcriptional regulator PadR